jgi:hypothetical protein
VNDRSGAIQHLVLQIKPKSATGHRISGAKSKLNHCIFTMFYRPFQKPKQQWAFRGAEQHHNSLSVQQQEEASSPGRKLDI